MRFRAALLFSAIVAFGHRASASSATCNELVRQGRALETSHEPDAALRRYNDAIGIDGSCGAAYVALGELRAKLGEGREAERVFTAGLSRVSDLREALLGRARVRHAMGREADAEEDTRALLENEHAEESDALALTVATLRELVSWYRELHAFPAELATWRRIHAVAVRSANSALERESRTMIRALVILVTTADPVMFPPRRDAFRKMVMRVSK